MDRRFIFGCLVCENEDVYGTGMVGEGEKPKRNLPLIIANSEIFFPHTEAMAVLIANSCAASL